MSFERGHLSIYFKDPAVLSDLQALAEKDLGGKTSVSSIVCDIVGAVLPQMREHVKKGKKNFKVTVNLDLSNL